MDAWCRPDVSLGAVRASGGCPSQFVQPPQVEREAHEVPFTGNRLQAAHTELPKTHDVFDPAEHRLGNDLASSVVRFAFGRGHALGHALCGGMFFRIDRARQHESADEAGQEGRCLLFVMPLARQEALEPRDAPFDTDSERLPDITGHARELGA